jgi:hypothetical protein
MSVSCSSSSGCFPSTYRKISTASGTPVVGAPSGPPILNTTYLRLKNGAVLSYGSYCSLNLSGDDPRAGFFSIDVNGDDKPNMYGRDYFSFVVTNSGKIISSYEAEGNNYDDDTFLQRCQQGSASECYAYLQAHNWNMNY